MHTQIFIRNDRLTRTPCRHSRSQKLLICLTSLVAMGLAVATPAAHAGNTWTGGGNSSNWDDNNNWGGSQPGYGTLTFSGNIKTTNVMDQSYNMNEMLWTGSSDWNINSANGAVMNLYDNSGTQAKVESQSTSVVTINLPITFAANNAQDSPLNTNGYNPWGEINAVNGNITFGTGALTINGSSVNGIRMYGNGHTTTFNDTVNASGKYFATTATNDTVAIGGAFTSGDFYLMNNGTLNLNSTGSLTTAALRLGGDLGTTGIQNSAQGATFNLTSTTGGQNFASLINSVSGNTSGALVINSQNISGTNTLSGGVYLDSNLTTTVAASGTLTLTGPTVDLKNQQMTVGGAGTTTISSPIQNSTGSGSIIKQGSGTLILFSGSPNTYTGGTTVSQGTMSGNASSYGSGAITVGSGATVDYTQSATNASASANAANAISGSGTATFGGQSGSQNGTGGTVNYTGTDSAVQTNVVSGTLALSNPSGAALTGPVAVASGATLQLNRSNQIAGTSNVTLNGGTLDANSSDATVDPNTAAVTPHMGTLTLGNGMASTLNFGAGATVSNPFILAFADSSSSLKDSTGTLNIVNYTGTTNALYIGTTNDLTSNELSRIAFNGVFGLAGQFGNGQIVATPEPSGVGSSLLGAGGLAGLVFLRRRRDAKAA